MATPAERLARTEGVLEQINERLGNLERRMLGQKPDNDCVEGLLSQKTDKSEFKFLFATTVTLLVVIIGLLGAVLART